MSRSFHACMIAGTNSGVGKTTIMAALATIARQKNLAVQCFKGGPDYIDPGYHEKASGRKCRNLDLHLLSPEYVKQSFARNSQDVDLALAEGMMGLYDGKNADGAGSSAQIAKLLDIPVVLVVDGAGLAASAAAIVLGFQKFDPETRLAGVIFNRVNSDGHFQYIKRAVESKTGVPCLGFLPREKITIPERHLGLTTAGECDSENKINEAAALLEKHLDWEKFLEVSVSFPRKRESMDPRFRGDDTMGKFQVAVARDEAFSFYYEDNFDLLKEAGAEIVFFSPLQEARIPEADLLYFGGGFPELYAERLLANNAMIESLHRFYHEGGKIYAECGGLIYMVFAGLVPGTIKMTERLQSFGYKELETAHETFLFPKGLKLRSHEFHYSTWDGEGSHTPVYKMGERSEGFAAERLVASYQHLHFGSNPAVLEHLKQNLTKRKTCI